MSKILQLPKFNVKVNALYLADLLKTEDPSKIDGIVQQVSRMLEEISPETFSQLYDIGHHPNSYITIRGKNYGLSLLHLCASVAMLKAIVQKITEKGLDPKTVLTTPNDAGISYVDVALGLYGENIAQYLIARKFIDETYRNPHIKNSTILHCSTVNPNLNVFFTVLASFPKLVGVANSDGKTPLRQFILRVINSINLEGVKTFFRKFPTIDGTNSKDLFAAFTIADTAQNYTNGNLLHFIISCHLGIQQRHELGKKAIAETLEKYEQLITYLSKIMPELTLRPNNKGETPFHMALRSAEKLAQNIFIANPKILLSSQAENISQDRKIEFLEKFFDKIPVDRQEKIFTEILEKSFDAGLPAITHFLVKSLGKLQKNPQRMQAVQPQVYALFFKAFEASQFELVTALTDYSEALRKDLKDLTGTPTSYFEQKLLTAIKEDNQKMAEKVLLFQPQLLNKLSPDAKNEFDNQFFRSALLQGRDEILGIMHKVNQKLWDQKVKEHRIQLKTTNELEKFDEEEKKFEELAKELKTKLNKMPKDPTNTSGAALSPKKGLQH